MPVSHLLERYSTRNNNVKIYTRGINSAFDLIDIPAQVKMWNTEKYPNLLSICSHMYNHHILNRLSKYTPFWTYGPHICKVFATAFVAFSPHHMGWKLQKPLQTAEKQYHHGLTIQFTKNNTKTRGIIRNITQKYKASALHSVFKFNYGYIIPAVY